MLWQMGFPETSIGWVWCFLESGTSSVLLNGVSSGNFRCRRGVRQWDPLSPLLFVHGAELLQHVINDLKGSGLINFPILVDASDFPMV
jgi:hypothetical protein